MYFTNTKPIKGTMKHRYSDFIVQEISFDNKICRNLPEGVVEEINIPENKENKQFLHFTLQKTNFDVQNVVKGLALNQKCGKNRIGFAGLKDKRGITSQRISIFEPNIEQLSKFKQNMIKLFDFYWHDTKIDLGDLKGNFFTIVIRDIDLPKEEIEKIFVEFVLETKNGIPNYFGEQRFGGIRQITHKVGKLIFEGKLKDAIILYLSATHEKETEEIKSARNLAKEEKYNESFKMFKGNEFRYERAILNSLIKEPNDFVKAFQQLPKNLMILFPHAYQSFLYNNYLDLRIRKGLFNKKLDDDVLIDNEIQGPLFGSEFILAEGINGELQKQVLKDENIILEQFKVKNFPQMSVQGSYRNISLQITDLQLLEIKEDEFFTGKNCLKISFRLTKNSYATTVLNELMKSDTNE